MPLKNIYQKYTLILYKYIKWLLFFGTVMYLSYIIRKSYTDFSVFLENFKSYRVLYLVLFFMLMPLNWFIECIKWRIIINKIQPLTVLNSFKAMFVGLNAGLFTPNRVGEYAGRLMYINQKNRPSAIMATFFTNISQLLITASIGIIAIANSASVLGNWYMIIYVFLGFILLLTVFPKLLLPVANISFLRKYSSNISFFIHFPMLQRWTIILLSVGRYSVYFFQYYLLFLFLGFNLNIFEVLLAQAQVFVVQSFIPNFLFIDIGIRGVISVFYYKHLVPQALYVVAVSTLVWFTNIIMPAFIGSVIIINSKKL